MHRIPGGGDKKRKGHNLYNVRGSSRNGGGPQNFTTLFRGGHKIYDMLDRGGSQNLAPVWSQNIAVKICPIF